MTRPKAAFAGCCVTARCTAAPPGGEQIQMEENTGEQLHQQLQISKSAPHTSQTSLVIFTQNTHSFPTDQRREVKCLVKDYHLGDKC